MKSVNYIILHPIIYELIVFVVYGGLKFTTFSNENSLKHFSVLNDIEAYV